MSGIVGVFHLDGRRADLDLLTRMTDVIAHRGPDGVGHWIDGPVGLGHRMLHTTPESLQEQQPLRDAPGTLCLALDGRVDNRDELRMALEASGAKLRSDTDAEMVLRAYECWGEECPKRIIGDFAFAIWDRRNQQLFCARDALGVKPLYYHFDGRTFVWGSELRSLFESTTVRREPNDGMIGEYLTGVIIDQEETLFRDVFRLLPAHFLLVGPRQFRKGRYFDFDLASGVRHRTDGEYAEHFLETFKEAVRCRLRSQGPVGAHLSGGLDSASVVVAAQSLFHDAVLPDSGFETFSLVFPGLPCDESSYIENVVERWGIKPNLLGYMEADPSCYTEQVYRYLDFPNFPNGEMFHPFMARARDRGFRVLLTGLGGDDWLSGSIYHYADLLRELKVLEVLRQIRFDSRVAGLPFGPAFPLFSVLRLACWPFVPRPARRVAKWMVGLKPVPRWINARFARRIHLVERVQQRTGGRKFSSRAQEDVCRFLTSGSDSLTLETVERSSSWFGLEQRHPFHDRRVVAFALALPEDQRWRHEQTKFVLRQAMRGLLPETVRQRLGKADFSHVVLEALRAQGGERFFESLAIASVGWVDGGRVRTMYRQLAQGYARGDTDYTRHLWPLWMICGIELWFNIVFLKGAAVQQERLHIVGAGTESV